MKRTIIFALLMVGFISLPANAQLNIFLDMPPIKGDSTVQAFPNQIVVRSWGQSVANVNSMPVVLPLVFTHDIDKATPDLIEAALMGTVFGTATLSIVDAACPQPGTWFMQLELDDASVVSVKNGGDENTTQLVETVTLTCANFTLRHREQDVNGCGMQSSPPVTGSCGN